MSATLPEEVLVDHETEELNEEIEAGEKETEGPPQLAAVQKDAGPPDAPSLNEEEAVGSETGEDIEEDAPDLGEAQQEKTESLGYAVAVPQPQPNSALGLLL